MTLHTVAAACASLVLLTASALSQCPAVNVAPGCNAVITLTDTGDTVTPLPANGTNYDGSDDALIGIINNTSHSVSSLLLNGNGVDIYGFDGDGLTTFGIPGNSMDPSGYGGPDTFYTNISADLTMGTLNFVTPLAANGGSTYFGLESIFDAANPPTPGPISSTPEPQTWLLLGTGSLGLIGNMRRRVTHR